MKFKGTIKIDEKLKTFLLNPSPELAKFTMELKKGALGIIKKRMIQKASKFKRTGDLIANIDEDILRGMISQNQIKAIAHEKGAFIKPRGKKVLMFRGKSGEKVFTRYARIKPKKYFYSSGDDSWREIKILFDKSLQDLVRKIA